MWIKIIGASGTGKNFVADYLVRQGFELLTLPTITQQNFKSHLKISMDKLRNQLVAASMKERSNVITVGSYWDSHFVYSKVLKEFDILSKEEKDVLDTIFNAHKDPQSLQPPHAVIYTTADQMSAMNRMKLRGVDFNNDLYLLQVKEFKEFIQRVRVPVVEVEANANPEITYQALDFGINSLKASALTSGSVWGRNFFYE